MISKELNVCVTGAAGQIAYSILPLIASGKTFGENVMIDLRLLDIPPAELALTGVVMELEDGAYNNLRCVSYGSDPKICFKEVDVVVFLGGFPRKEGMERKELLAKNCGIFKEQGAALDEVANKHVKCVVVANPANTNCLALSTYAPSIPKKNFSALTRLDHNRAQYQVAAKLGTQVSNVKNVIIWGNHSSTQFPDVRHAQADGKPVPDDDYWKGDFIPKVQKRGGAIIAARKLSSAMSAANATVHHLRDWYMGTPEGIHVSMAVIIENGEYGIDTPLCFSVPVKCSNFEYEIVNDLDFDDFGKEKFEATLKELLEEKADAEL
jgi:malate dehydrogenase